MVGNMLEMYEISIYLTITQTGEFKVHSIQHTVQISRRRDECHLETK